VADSAKVLDALKDPVNGYYDPRDIFTSVPRSSVLSEPYAKQLAPGTAGSLKGMRIGIMREFMIKHAKADEPIVDAAAAEMKRVLVQHLGATLVETTPPGWVDDLEIENMKVSFDRALAQIAPVLYPEILYRLTASGEPEFPDFAAKIEPTEFAPGVIRGTGTMQPVDWMIRWADGLEPTPKNLNMRSIVGSAGARTFRFHIPQYLARRAKDWADRGYTETVVDFRTLNPRSKFWGDDQRAAFRNWEETDDIRNPLDERQGIHERFLLREFLRRVEMKVLHENKLDVVVRLHSSLPPGKIGLAPQPGPEGGQRGESAFGPNGGLTEVLIPAGYVRTIYDPTFALSPDRKRYVSVNNNTPTEIPAPGLPFSLVFRAEPGKEDLILKVASAYQAASKRRVPPPAFGPLPATPSRGSAATASQAAK
jgi:amidase